MHRVLFVWFLVIALVPAACGRSDEEAAPADEPAREVQTMAGGDSPDGLPEVNPLEVTGNIITAGSSTVFPLSEAMAERFMDEGYADNITIDSIGSGAGFERFCVAGESDISNASRAIKDSERESCAAIDLIPIEFRVGTDALAVTVSRDNEFVSNLSMEQLALVFSTAITWADVNPDWPAEPIQRFSPGTDSGTFDYFVEEVFDKDKEPILSADALQLSEDDNVLVQGVTGSPYAVGYFGYAYYQENADTLKIVAINDVEATTANVDNGIYPLARPLYIYSDAGIMAEKPQVAAFINFLLTYVNEEIERAGYFPAESSVLEAAKQSLLHAMSAPTGGAKMAMLPEVNPLEVTGDIITAGSSTVFPLSEAMAERFMDEGYADNITIDSIGSGAGFERFCVAGESDISNASRAIKDSERESCAAIDLIPIEFRVGTDALAVTVSRDNEFVSNLSMEQLALVFSTAITWADVNPDWPAEPIQRFSPGTDSGTFDYFVEEVFDKDKEPILSADALQLSEDDNVLVQGVTGSPYAVGYFGYAYYQENADTLKIVAINDVEATTANVDNGIYPLARPLYIYSDAGIMAEKPQVAGFINFFLTYVNEEIERAGYFPAEASVLEAAKQSLLNATKAMER
ncbi:MAG: PstS family phosphate ABC transporter substrate-binding protein [Caldilineaceae bacterium]|nr:PstS family phosphate ABC transporter substrate-binding protein [Caldilineaceae bacterium]